MISKVVNLKKMKYKKREEKTPMRLIHKFRIWKLKVVERKKMRSTYFKKERKGKRGKANDMLNLMR